MGDFFCSYHGLEILRGCCIKIRGEKMNSEAIFNAAHSTAMRLMESGAFISPSDTVCALQTASGRIYTGISRTEINNQIHAAIDAVHNMLAGVEKIISGLLLISTQTGAPMLPCNNCLGYILSLAQENTGCMILLQDRMIGINEVGRFAAPMGGIIEPNFGGHTPAAPQFTSPHAAAAVSIPNPTPTTEPDVATVTENAAANTENSTGDLLKTKVNTLLKAVDDTDEFLESLPTKKKKFGFFRK